MSAETPQIMRVVNNHLQGQSSSSSTIEATQGKSQPPPSSSATSSPAHEFSFTISLNQSTTSTSAAAVATPPASAAAGPVDLSPADDIFFHGHLLPLHLLSHLPSSNISPRASTNSLESFTLPIRELLEDRYPTNINSRINSERRSEETPKSKNSFSLLKWRKNNKEEATKDSQKKRRKLRFDVSQVLKRYISMVRPMFISLRRRRSERGLELRGGVQSCSFSGSLTPTGRGSGGGGGGGGGGRRRLFSAPASMRTSPTNSGLLAATGPAGGVSSTSDSTMEELQAAIQAAIAHCKNSIAMDGGGGGGNNEIIKC